MSDRPPTGPDQAPAVPATAQGAPAGPPAPVMGAEWAAKAVDAIDLVVNTVGDRAVRPVLLAARGIVFGLVIVVMAGLVGIVASVALVRLLDVYAFGGRVWAADALLGVVLTAAGFLAWSRRLPRPGGEKG